ncbi:MAG TPA: family 2A encapsulin nanocompartment cargo protein cysteine desulfurase [Candidatus Angelobacter sp.]|jgi:cysteine desulfurase/selenocysteine lyase|nr:family 2A encapsulin nanocompartment cargo protein cysteine desulfurase [Candidatus Angelobacter sp.]
MSTNDPKPKVPTENWATVLTGTENLPIGLPNPAMLARMANEFFTALPGALQASIPPVETPLKPTSAFVPSKPTDTQAQPLLAIQDTDMGTDMPVTAFSGGQDFSFLEEVRPLLGEPAGNSTAKPAEPSGFSTDPASLEGEALPFQFPEFFQPPTPTIPGSLGVADSSAVPMFSFMEEARPLFSGVHGSAPALGPKPEAEKRKSTEKTTGTQTRPAPDATTTDARSPQVPGAVAHPAAFQPLASFDFLQLARPLARPETAPAIQPLNSQIETLPDLGLPAYSFDVEAIRRDFPILRERVNGRPLVWLDNAATTQKPQSVIDRLTYYYTHENSNVHRAAHELAARATDAYESAREKVRRFLNASAAREIVFVRGATEGINLVAQSWGRHNVDKDDEIVITWLEHHANIVPWQMLCAEKGARLRVVPVDDCGQVILDEYEKLLGPKTRLVSLPQVSNALGTVIPVKAMIEAAHRHGAKVLVDGAQAVSHMRVDVQTLDCDFYVLSGHKLFAPTGIGVVYGKSEVLDVTPPWQGGGSMIADVTFEKTVYQPPPQRFEAGTGNIADAIGLGAAIDYLDRVGMVNISRHEHELLTYGTAGLQRIPGLHIIGNAKEKAGVLSFILDGFRTEEIGDFLNRRGIAVRAGHHCAQPIHRRFGIETSLRASLALYNNFEDIDALIAALWDLKQGRNPGLV